VVGVEDEDPFLLRQLAPTERGRSSMTSRYGKRTVRILVSCGMRGVRVNPFRACVFFEKKGNFLLRGGVYGIWKK
jgi:hypothetical protein